jgi:hypothetical protein
MVIVFLFALCVSAGSVGAQNRYDESEMDDRLYLTLGGFRQDDLKTTLRVDAKNADGGIAAGAVILVESLFDLDNQVTTARLDGWWRFGKKHRIGWTYFASKREGLSTYSGDPIEIGEITINPGDFIATEDRAQLVTVDWVYSFVNTSKYEAWIGAGLNVQDVDLTIDVNVGGGSTRIEESAKGTVPIPTFNFGGRYNFTKKVRMMLFQQMFGLKIGDFEGKLNNTRVLAEWSITKNFGIGGGMERFSLEIEAEGEDFQGFLDSSYTAFTLYVKGQL